LAVHGLCRARGALCAVLHSCVLPGRQGPPLCFIVLLVGPRTVDLRAPWRAVDRTGTVARAHLVGPARVSPPCHRFDELAQDHCALAVRAILAPDLVPWGPRSRSLQRRRHVGRGELALPCRARLPALTVRRTLERAVTSAHSGAVTRRPLPCRLIHRVSGLPTLHRGDTCGVVRISRRRGVAE